MDIPVNAKVYCTDGPCGRSVYVIINPMTRQVTHLVVKPEKSPRTERLVPVSEVMETTPRLVRLRCTRDELATFILFIDTEYIQADVPYYDLGYEADEYMIFPFVTPAVPVVIPVKHEHIPPGELAVRRGARVVATDGRVGRVDEFLVDPPTGHITHLVMREGHLLGKKDVTIPISQIDRMENGVVYLKLDKNGIKGLAAIPVQR
jgi:sporulation protein YlmC with PRC-barrel domain